MTMKPPAKPCWRWKRRVTLLAARALSDRDTAPVSVHMHSCPGCQHLFRETQALSEQLSDLGQSLPDAQPSPALRRRWLSTLETLPHPIYPNPQRVAGLADPGWLTDWLPGGRRAWSAVAGCWALALLLQLLAPRVSTPTASAPQVPLGEVLSLLQSVSADTPAFAPPSRPAPPDHPNDSGTPGDQPQGVHPSQFGAPGSLVLALNPEGRASGVQTQASAFGSEVVGSRASPRRTQTSHAPSSRSRPNLERDRA